MQQLPLKVHYMRFVEQIANRATVDGSFLIPCLIPLPFDVNSQSYCKNLPLQPSKTTNGLKKQNLKYELMTKKNKKYIFFWQILIPFDGIGYLTLDLKVSFISTPLSPNNWWDTKIMKDQREAEKNHLQNSTKCIHIRPNKHPECKHLHTTLALFTDDKIVFSLGSCGWMCVICNFVLTSCIAVVDCLNSPPFCIGLNISSPLQASGIPLHSHYGCLHIPMAVCWKVPIWAICCQSRKKLGLRWKGSHCTFPHFHEATNLLSTSPISNTCSGRGKKDKHTKGVSKTLS